MTTSIILFLFIPRSPRVQPSAAHIRASWGGVVHHAVRPACPLPSLFLLLFPLLRTLGSSLAGIPLPPAAIVHPNIAGEERIVTMARYGDQYDRTAHASVSLYLNPSPPLSLCRVSLAVPLVPSSSHLILQPRHLALHLDSLRLRRSYELRLPMTSSISLIPSRGTSLFFLARAGGRVPDRGRRWLKSVQSTEGRMREDTVRSLRSGSTYGMFSFSPSNEATLK